MKPNLLLRELAVAILHRSTTTTPHPSPVAFLECLQPQLIATGRGERVTDSPEGHSPLPPSAVSSCSRGTSKGGWKGEGMQGGREG